jgi:hypothetical protein
MMQAFACRHLVPADSLTVMVLARGGVRVPARIVGDEASRIPIGGSARVRVLLPPGVKAFENIQFELSEPPDGIELRDATVNVPEGEFVLQADGSKAKAGLRGNLIVTVSGERAPRERGNQAAPPAAARRRVPIATLPAIPFEVIPPR